MREHDDVFLVYTVIRFDAFSQIYYTSGNKSTKLCAPYRITMNIACGDNYYCKVKSIVTDVTRNVMKLVKALIQMYGIIYQFHYSTIWVCCVILEITFIIIET